MNPHKVVSRDEWLAARKAHLKNEKALTRMRDLVNAERRALPWVKVEKNYVFDTPNGKASLADLFDGRSQLAVYHFMLAPGSNNICNGCALLADHFDATRMHFENADLTLTAVSRARLSEIEPVKKRMGWRFPWASSFGSDFNYDFGVSFTPEQIARGEAQYNYAPTSFKYEDLHGLSVFAKDNAGVVYHTYSTYARGGEALIGAFSFLDLAPKGRNEDGIMSWVRLHDEYEDRSDNSDGCCQQSQKAS